VVYAVVLSQSENSAALVAVDAATGDRIWSQPVADPQLFVAPAVADGVVVDVDGHVAHAYAAGSGEELWSLRMSRPVAGSPYISDGRVFLVQRGNGNDVDDAEYRLTVHDLRTGRLEAAWEPVGDPFISHPVVGGTPDGRVVIPDLGITIVGVAP
jgi:outer membrane protein assembly factor BamB